MKSENELVPVTDKELIVFLVASGLELKDNKYDKMAKRSTLFFKNDEAFNSAVINYANGTGNVNIADYIAVEKRVKTLLCVPKVGLNY